MRRVSRKAPTKYAVKGSNLAPKAPNAPIKVLQAAPVRQKLLRKPWHKLAPIGTGRLFIAVFGTPELMEMIADALGHGQIYNFIRATCRLMRKMVVRYSGDSILDYFVSYANMMSYTLFVNEMIRPTHTLTKGKQLKSHCDILPRYRIENEYTDVAVEYQREFATSVVKYCNTNLFTHYNLRKYPGIIDIIIEYDCAELYVQADLDSHLYVGDMCGALRSELVHRVVDGKCHKIIARMAGSLKDEYPVACMLPYVVFEDDIDVNRHVRRMRHSALGGHTSTRCMAFAITNRVLPSLYDDDDAKKYLPKLIAMLNYIDRGYARDTETSPEFDRFVDNVFIELYNRLNTGIQWRQYVIDAINTYKFDVW